MKAGVLSFSILLAVLFYKKDPTDSLTRRMESVLTGLLHAENKVRMTVKPRVAVGFGGCLDYLSDGISVLKKVGAAAPDHPVHSEEIHSKEDLENIFSYFFRHGAAAERYIENASLFRDLTTAASTLPGTVTAIGGNAPAMASRFQKEGCQVLLGATVSDGLRNSLAGDIEVAGGNLDDDDIHLLLEYQANTAWGKHVAKRANRFIVHNDVSNPTLSSLEDFAQEVTSFSPTLLVVGGLQMMDNFPFQPGQREKRLRKLQHYLASVPKSTRIHFEMASFAEESCLKDVIDNVVYHADSLGMNEQELPNLLSVMTNGSVTLLSDPYPRVATTLDQMRQLYRLLFQAEGNANKRPLTRIHVHTLAFQAILTRHGSSWKNTMSAAAKASLTANRHTCGSNSISLEKAKILMDESFSKSKEEGSPRVEFQDNRPVSCWNEEDYKICLAPVLVCTEVRQTGGGGDNISSAGLVLQI